MKNVFYFGLLWIRHFPVAGIIIGAGIYEAATNATVARLGTSVVAIGLVSLLRSTAWAQRPGRSGPCGQ